ncbi:hypothetical protein PQX77_016029 [Marasmius sp. AFHP31]|nr:hypothetical protein PQX77_016029 [Marasmius sp. AFHP31]
MSGTKRPAKQTAPKLKLKLSVPQEEATQNTAKEQASVKKPTEPKEPEKKKHKVIVNWNKEPHSLIEQLLTGIMDSPTRCEAFGSVRPPDAPSNNSQGKTVEANYRDLAHHVFLKDDAPPKWKEEGCTTDDLWKSCSNWVKGLKSPFIAYQNKLGKTGSSIVMAGNEDMLHGDLTNIWEEIQQKFLYYKTMEQFYGSNPLVNLSAVTNSRSDIKTDVLRHGGDDDDGDSVDVDDEHTPSKSSHCVFPSPDSSLADTVDSIQTTPATGPSTPCRKRPVDASSDIELTETPTRPCNGPLFYVKPEDEMRRKNAER